MKPVALVCIAKDEGPYIKEWIDYHLKIGFDHIFVYENDWRSYGVDDPRVTRVPFDGRGVQYDAYNNFILNHKHQYSWAAFFDVDEFLVLKKHTTIQNFIHEYRRFNGVGINSVFFGDNNQPPPTDEFSVLKRFTKCSPTGDSLAKVLVRMSDRVRMGATPHVNLMIVTTHKVPYRACRSPTVETDIAQLNHYYYKSRVEHTAKIRRGKANRERPYHDAEFPTTWANVVTDTTARDFLYPPTKDNHAVS